MIIRKSNDVEQKYSLQDSRNCKESGNVEKAIESKKLLSKVPEAVGSVAKTEKNSGGRLLDRQYAMNGTNIGEQL